jgi:hypothetical protein
MMRAIPFWCWLALLALLVIQQATTAELAATVSPPRAAVSLVAYGNADLTVVRELRRVSLPEGETEVVLAWPGAAVDASSVRLLTPEGLKIAVAAKPPRKNDEIRWMLEAEAGTYDLQVAYFSSGIEWKPYYRLLLNEGTGAVSLEGLVDLRNRSGQAFDNAEVCLVVGELRLVANLAEAAWKALPAYKEEKKGPPPAASAGLSERYVYDLGTLPHLAQEDTYTVPFMPRVELQTGVLYRFHPAKYDQEVHRLLVFRNSPDLGLGDVPLAGAEAQVREVATNGPVPRGTVAVPYTPVGEECEIDLGPSTDVKAERRVVELRRANIEFDRFGKVEGYDDHETVEVEISNWSMRPVTVEYTDTVPGVWDVASDEPFAEEGMNEVIFVLEMEPQTTQKLHYRLVKRQGKRVRLGPTRPK